MPRASGSRRAAMRGKHRRTRRQLRNRQRRKRIVEKLLGFLGRLFGDCLGYNAGQGDSTDDTTSNENESSFSTANTPNPSTRSTQSGRTAEAKERFSFSVLTKKDEVIAAPAGDSPPPPLLASTSFRTSDVGSSPCSSSGDSSPPPPLMSSSSVEDSSSFYSCSLGGNSSSPPPLVSSSSIGGDSSSLPSSSFGGSSLPPPLISCSDESAGSSCTCSSFGENEMQEVSGPKEKSDPLADSAKLGRGWEVSSTIGRGAMARINGLRCEDAELQGRINALTNGRGLVVKRPLNKRAEPFLVQEIIALRTLVASAGESPKNVLQVLSLDMPSRTIVMERLDADLDSVLHDRDRMVHISSRDRMRVLGEVTKGLRKVHEAGLTHADLKPANILLTTDLLTVKLADFGLSGLSSTDRVRGGTPLYMAPEAAVACVRPEGTVLLEPEMDLYALGLIMLSLLQRSTEVAGSSKARLYDDDGDSAKRPLNHHKYQRFKMCDSFNFKLPSDLLLSSQIQNVVRLLLSKDPRRRLPVAALLPLLQCDALWATCEEDGVVDNDTQDTLQHISSELSKPIDGQEWYLQIGRPWWETSLDSEGVSTNKGDEEDGDGDGDEDEDKDEDEDEDEDTEEERDDIEDEGGNEDEHEEKDQDEDKDEDGDY